MKRIFKVDLENYGGELTIGTVTSDFVEYWKNHIGNDPIKNFNLSEPLINHLNAVKWGESDGLDKDSPKIQDQDFQPPWDAIDNIEHLWGIYSDCTLKVTEVSGIDGDNINDVEDFESYGSLYSREAYFEADLPDKSNIGKEDDYQPVLLVHNSEKGNFGSVFVETENGKDFDPQEFAFGQCENNYFEIIDSFYYDGKKLAVNMDWVSTSEKNGFFVMVGYFNMRYHDKKEKYTKEYLKENNYWEE